MPRSTTRPADLKQFRSMRHSAGCWRPTSCRRWTCRRSIARTSMASPSWRKTRSARPRKCRARVLLAEEEIHTGIVPTTAIHPGKAVLIATGGMVPRGADAVVMIEYAEARGRELRIARAVTAGSGVSFAGTDITAGETVLRQGQLLTSRDTGVLAAIGVPHVKVWRKPIVAILSTGDEIIAPGDPMQPAKVYDSNAQVLADAVRELGGEPRRLGITHDDVAALRERLQYALEFADIVLLSGGTSKGAGDVSYRVVAELDDPGIVAHGVALKPGKPICLAATGGRAVVVLPGFPTSAIFTFHEFVAPVIRLLAGRGSEERTTVSGQTGGQGE